jgi:hypothetical protein
VKDLNDFDLGQIADALTDVFIVSIPRIARAVVYGVAAYVLSFALPAFMPSIAFAVAAVLLALTRRTIILADVLLAGIILLAFIQPQLLRFFSL